MASSTSHNLSDILSRLAKAGVDFILVGGLAAVAQGAPITTFDVDIVHERSERNVGVLLEVLTALDARYRGRPGGPPLPPDARSLQGPGHSLFMTKLGPVDVLGEIEGRRGYHELLEHTIALPLNGHRIHVLSLEMIVHIKRASKHPKDQQALPILEAMLRRGRQD